MNRTLCPVSSRFFLLGFLSPSGVWVSAEIATRVQGRLGLSLELVENRLHCLWLDVNDDEHLVLAADDVDWLYRPPPVTHRARARGVGVARGDQHLVGAECSIELPDLLAQIYDQGVARVARRRQRIGAAGTQREHAECGTDEHESSHGSPLFLSVEALLSTRRHLRRG